MKTNLRQNIGKIYMWIIYITIFIICILCIGITIYSQYYKDSKIGLIFGMSDSDSEEKDAYEELKSEFPSLFTNKVEKLQENVPNVDKITDKEDIIATGYTIEKKDGNKEIGAYIPQINIREDKIYETNKKIREKYKTKADEIINYSGTDNKIYTVSYIAYLQNDILSLVIRSELKEGNKNQKIEIQTFNYDIGKKKMVTAEELFLLKNIDIKNANLKIEEEIKEIQEQNDALAEILSNQNGYKRDLKSSKYEIQNAEQYFLGKDGRIYIIYAYGNEDYTNEMDIVIFK